MKIILSYFLIFLLLFLLFTSFLFAEELPIQNLSKSDYTVLKVCEGIIQLFKQFPDSVWPGYNLSERPFIVYVPEKWVLLFNYSKETDGFGSYPQDWPDLGAGVLFYQGQYKHLAGQLVFNLPIDTVEVTAVSFYDQTPVKFFEYVVHENFHQYQYEKFGEIPWEREQKYPIQDKENTALAYVEMRLLMDATEAAHTGERKKAEEYVKQFVAVRDHRWRVSDAFVKRYEQGKEINEGTAKYVEIKSSHLMAKLKYKTWLAGPTTPLSEDFSSISMPEFLLNVFKERITGNSISPEAVPRYRIYPVGSAQGFLLDYFNIDWKTKAQKAGPEFIYVKLFKEHLNIDEREFEDLLKNAKENYDYEKVLASTQKLIQEYTDGFNRELQSFETQSGYRFEIELKSSGVRRSRSSREKKWLVEKGTKELCRHFNIYSLKNDDLLLQVHDSGLLEQNDWEKKKRKVIFYVPEIISILLDRKPLKPSDGKYHQFENIKIIGDNVKFSYSKEGTIIFTEDIIKIDLAP